MSKRRDLIERRQQEQRKQTMVLLVVIVAVALVIVGGAIAVTVTQNQPKVVPINTSSKPLPPNAEANGRAWGPADAPIKVLEFVDYQCPSCGVQSNTYEAGIISTLANTGKVRYEIHLLAFIGPESKDAAVAALCAAEQDKFWPMHNTLFANQQGENQNGFSQDRLRQIAQTAGLDMTAYNQCASSGKFDTTLSADDDLSKQYGINSTPSFVVNGKLYPGIRSVTDLTKIAAELAPDVKLGQ